LFFRIWYFHLYDDPVCKSLDAFTSILNPLSHRKSYPLLPYGIRSTSLKYPDSARSATAPNQIEHSETSEMGLIPCECALSNAHWRHSHLPPDFCLLSVCQKNAVVPCFLHVPCVCGTVISDHPICEAEEHHETDVHQDPEGQTIVIYRSHLDQLPQGFPENERRFARRGNEVSVGSFVPDHQTSLYHLSEQRHGSGVADITSMPEGRCIWTSNPVLCFVICHFLEEIYINGQMVRKVTYTL